MMKHLAANTLLVRQSMPPIMRLEASQTLWRRIKRSQSALKSS
jgi:hypothetical protein